MDDDDADEATHLNDDDDDDNEPSSTKIQKPAKITDIVSRCQKEQPSTFTTDPVTIKERISWASDPVTHNVVARFRISYKGDLRDLAWAICGGIWERFARPVCFYAKHPGYAVLFFETRNVIVTGNKSQEAALYAAHNFCALIHQVTGKVTSFRDFTITNQMSCIHTGFLFDHLAMYNAYRLELVKKKRFGGVIWKRVGEGTALCFPTGSIVLTGTKTHQDILKWRDRALPRLAQFCIRRMTKEELDIEKQKRQKEIDAQKLETQKKSKQFRTKAKIVRGMENTRMAVNELIHVVELADIKVDDICVEKNETCFHKVFVRYEDLGDEYLSLGRMDKRMIEQLFQQNPTIRLPVHFRMSKKEDEYLYDDDGEEEEEEEDLIVPSPTKKHKLIR